FLYQRLLKAAPAELPVVRDLLLPQGALKAGRPGEALRERLWGLLENRKNDSDQRLRAACALAKSTPDDPRWGPCCGDVSAKLMTEKPVVLGKWLDALRPSADHLLPLLATLLEDEKRTASEVRKAASLYGNLAEGRPDAVAALEERLAKPNAPVGRPGPGQLAVEDEWEELRNAPARRRANLGMALAVMGRWDKFRPLLKHSPDPTVRSYLIERLGPTGIDLKMLAARLDQEPDVSIRRAIVLSLGQFEEVQLLRGRRELWV